MQFLLKKKVFNSLFVKTEVLFVSPTHSLKQIFKKRPPHNVIIKAYVVLDVQNKTRKSKKGQVRRLKAEEIESEMDLFYCSRSRL